MKKLALIIACVCVLHACVKQYDVVVVGGGTGGTAAAIEAARAGAKVLVVKEYDHDVTIPQPEDYNPEHYRGCCDVWSPDMMLSYGRLQ